MKYLIRNQVINSDHIVSVKFSSESSIPSHCDITMSSTGSFSTANDVIILRGADADAFWEAYSGDAYKVIVAKEEAQS